jgi:hypothetical protein
MNFPLTAAGNGLGSGTTNLVLADMETNAIGTYFLMVPNCYLN